MAAAFRTLVPIPTNALPDVLAENFDLPTGVTFEQVEKARMAQEEVSFEHGPWSLELQEIRPDEWRIHAERG